MEKVIKLQFSHVIKKYLVATKPGIIMGNSVTAIGGFTLATRGELKLISLLFMLIGLSSVIASACVLNNCMDKEIDAKMTRTKKRPMVLGAITTKNALVFAGVLASIGFLLLGAMVNLLAMSAALFGFITYVVFYSPLKYYTVQGTLIGSLAGAVPPVVGYTAVTNQMDAAAWILFAIIAFWQMPHFYAIAIYRIDDYENAGIPVLPLKKGIFATKVQMLFYTLGFCGVASLLTILHYTNTAFLVGINALGAAWVLLNLMGFKASDDQKWARKMFIFSLVIVMSLSVLLPICSYSL